MHINMSVCSYVLLSVCTSMHQLQTVKCVQNKDIVYKPARKFEKNSSFSKNTPTTLPYIYITKTKTAFRVFWLLLKVQYMHHIHCTFILKIGRNQPRPPNVIELENLIFLSFQDDGDGYTAFGQNRLQYSYLLYLYISATNKVEEARFPRCSLIGLRN